MVIKGIRDLPYPLSLSAKPSWRIPANIICGATYLLSKAFVKIAVNVQQRNTDRFTRAIFDRPKGTPLITVSNHSSCIDDPIIWGVVPIRRNFTSHARWIPGAKEILFKNSLTSYYFNHARAIPIVRGDGVYQKAVDYCINLLNEGAWIHVFPEGKVNLSNTTMRLKWGIGRIISEVKRTPIVLPFWHSGMESILPERTYFPRFFKFHFMVLAINVIYRCGPSNEMRHQLWPKKTKRLTVSVGDPIDFSQLLEIHRKQRSNAVIIRKHITDIIQDRFAELKTSTEELHAKWTKRT